MRCHAMLLDFFRFSHAVFTTAIAHDADVGRRYISRAIRWPETFRRRRLFRGDAAAFHAMPRL